MGREKYMIKKVEDRRPKPYFPLTELNLKFAVHDISKSITRRHKSKNVIFFQIVITFLTIGIPQDGVKNSNIYRFHGTRFDAKIISVELADLKCFRFYFNRTLANHYGSER